MYNYFIHASDDVLSRQSINIKTRKLLYLFIDKATHY